VDEAVRSGMSVKIELGLFEQSLCRTDGSEAGRDGSTGEHLPCGTAAEKSLRAAEKCELPGGRAGSRRSRRRENIA